MSKNKIQLQIGLSEPEFIDRFGREEQCVAYLEKLKWPNGFTCGACSEKRYGLYQSGTRQIYQCCSCSKVTIKQEG